MPILMQMAGNQRGIDYRRIPVPHAVSAIAGVANTGTDRTGHHPAQANWYVFGRLAWNHRLEAGEIAREWIAMTFNNEEPFTRPLLNMMMRSRKRW